MKFRIGKNTQQLLCLSQIFYITPNILSHVTFETDFSLIFWCRNLPAVVPNALEQT